MAIIYTYPNLPLSSLSADDLLVITNVDATNNNPTKSVTLADIATYVTGTGSGTGTTNKIVKFTDGANGLLGDSIMTESTGLIDLAGQFVSTSSPTLTQAAPVSGIKAILNGTTAAPNVALYGESKNTGSTQADSNYGLFAKGEFEGTGGFTGFVIGGNLEGRYDGTGTNGANATIYGSYNLARATTAANGTVSYMIGANNLAKLEGANVTATNLQATHSTVELSNGTAGEVIVQILDFDTSGGGTVTGDLSYLQIQNDTMPAVAGTKRAINSKSVLPSLFTGQVEIPLVPTINAHATSKQYVDQQISSVVSGLVFISTWDASSTPGGSPDLTDASTQVVGHYYVVSVAGGATPNGAGTLPNSWNVGDWCIYVEQGATDRWEKLDQTFVSGAGAAGQVTYWNSQNEVAGDNNFFWDNTNKRLGIGTNTPVSKLETKDGDIRVTTLNAFSNLISSRAGVPNAGGYNTGGLLFQAYSTGTTFSTGAAIYSYADGAAWTATSVPSYLSFQTVPSGLTGLKERMRIDSAGDISIFPRAAAASSGSGILYFKNVDDNSATINGGSIRTVDSTNNPSGADIRFQVANDAGTLFDAVTIDSNGFMGIGTTAPDYALDVVGSARVNSTSSTTLNIQAKNPTAFNDPQLNFVTWNEASGSSSGKIQLTNGTFNSNDMAFFTETANSVTEKMRITSTGNVGIGTTSPNRALEVENSSGIGSMVLTGTTGSTLYFRPTASYSPGGNFGILTTGGSGPEFLSTMKFSGYNTSSGGVNTIMTLKGDGNVGIGITSPVAKLHVYQNNSDDDTTAGVTIEQDGTGDAALSFLLSTVRRWRLGIDNNDLDKFKISSATNLGTNNKLTIDVDGNVGIGTTAPESKLTIKGDPGNTNQPVRITNVTTDAKTGLFINGTGNAVDEKYGIQFGGYNQYSIGGIFGVLDSTGGSTSGDITFDFGNGTAAGALVEKVRFTHEGNATFAGAISSGAITASAKGSQFSSTGYYVNSTFKDVSDNCGVILGHNDTNNGIGVVAGINQLAFLTYGSAWTQALLLDASQNATFAGDVSLEKSTGSVFNLRRDDTSVVTGDDLGSIFFQGNDPSNPYKSGAAILAQGDGTWNMGTPNVYPSRLIFQTAEENTLKTAMVIKSDQKIGIGTTTPSYILVVSDNGGSGVEFIPQTTNNRTTLLSYNRSGGAYNTLDFDASDIHFNISGAEKMSINSSGYIYVNTGGAEPGASQVGVKITGTQGQAFWNSANSGTTGYNHFNFYNANGAVGSIVTNGSATAFNTSSDYRLKKDLKDFDGLDKVSKIPVYDFKWKVDDSSSYGVMAHELQEVLPNAVSGEKDGEEMQGVDYSKVVPLLIKSIQELEAKVKILENK